MKENNWVSFVKCQLCLVSVMLKVTYKTFMLNVIMLNVTMLNVIYAECRYAECHGAVKMKRFKMKLMSELFLL